MHALTRATSLKPKTDCLSLCYHRALSCRWGSSFSNKFFLEKRFVVKHILNKHQEKLDEHKVRECSVCSCT
jgi:hypothetical protein